MIHVSRGTEASALETALAALSRDVRPSVRLFGTTFQLTD